MWIKSQWGTLVNPECLEAIWRRGKLIQSEARHGTLYQLAAYETEAEAVEKYRQLCAALVDPDVKMIELLPPEHTEQGRVELTAEERQELLK